MAIEVTREVNLVNSIPHIPVSFYSSKYAKPIKVIVFLDTRAAQTIMNPEVLSKECFKPHTTPFNNAFNEACEAFYVNKRSEQIRGKLRLVINYQSLNHFLQDDKFPLRNKQALFTSKSKA
ncbi:hypothetical protein CRG98_031438 [Punica granatum]|uniref:Uncharacterized protein n=1 Tax=Punica granatum TaxID=22663 RepID=A0A2I0IWP3_PUNGR|nr:hypothetical protein CRG98_031438 [Punica granatum]